MCVSRRKKADISKVNYEQGDQMGRIFVRVVHYAVLGNYKENHISGSTPFHS
jgi:hypothetical protein